MTGFKAWIVWFCAVGIVVTGTPVLAGDRSLTDDEKKEIVYRMYQEYKSEDFPEVEDISPREAIALLAAGELVFVDTRRDAEMEVSMLPGAITRAKFLEDTGRYGEKKIVVYCTISFRSGEFARELAKRGVAVLNLEGGILAWALEGGKVYDSGGETRRIHVYGDKWNYAPAGFDTVEFGFFKRIF